MSAEQEAPVNRFRSRSCTVTQVGWLRRAACGLALVTALSGCSAGQITQTSVQEPSINGTAAIAGDATSGIALRNIHLRANQTSDYVKPGTAVDLLFVAVNESTEDKDRLVSITSKVGTVAVAGDATVPAGGVLVVGTPDGLPSPLDATEAAKPVEAKVALTEQITNGETYDFTFTFERSGSVSVAVPISAGEAPRREAPRPGVSGTEEAAEADTGGHH
jgi:copper(I)-binding protein